MSKVTETPGKPSNNDSICFTDKRELLYLMDAVRHSCVSKYLFLAACLLKFYYLTDAGHVLREFKYPGH